MIVNINHLRIMDIYVVMKRKEKNNPDASLKSSIFNVKDGKGELLVIYCVFFFPNPAMNSFTSIRLG